MDERKKILEMLAEGKINVDEAERLLRAVEASIQRAHGAGSGAATGDGPRSDLGSTAGAGTGSDMEKKAPKFLRIHVESGGESGPENVNVRVPMSLLYSGMKLAAMMPSGLQSKVESSLREQGIHVDLAKLQPHQLEDLVTSLAQLTVDVDSKHDKVRIFCE